MVSEPKQCSCCVDLSLVLRSRFVASMHANLCFVDVGTVSFPINWSASELNTKVNPTTCLGDTSCWIQQVTAPTLVVTCWIQQPVSPKQVVGFTCVFTSEGDKLIRKLLGRTLEYVQLFPLPS